MLNKTDFYFLTIAEEGNLNTAAQKLYVSQPSLSKYIQRLEHQLGTKLFDRSCSPMKLNEAGNLYLRHLMDSMEQEKQLLDQLQEIDGEIRGTLRLGIPPFWAMLSSKSASYLCESISPCQHCAARRHGGQH